MSEFPNTKPIQNIKWALTGRKRLPFFSRQNGFIDDTPPLLDEWNYMADAHERKITHQEGRVYRAFDSIVDAVDTLDPGDVFFYNRWGMAWYETGTQDVGLPGGPVHIERITTDGRRVFAVWNVSLKAFTATANFSGTTFEEWFFEFSGHPLGGPTSDLHLDTDGVIVVLAGSTHMLVLDAVTGDLIAYVATGTVAGLRCYSVGGTPKVFFHDGDVTISTWTLADGVALLHTVETAGQVLVTPIEPADDRLWFMTINLTSGANQATHIPIDGGGETVVDPFGVMTFPSQDIGTLDYDAQQRRMLVGYVHTTLNRTKIFDINGAGGGTLPGGGPWNISSRWAFGPGLPFGVGASVVAYRDNLIRKSVAEMYDTGTLWGPGVETVGSIYRWFTDDADPVSGLFATGILCQPGLWKIREGVGSGANRRLIAQPLGVNYG